MKGIFKSLFSNKKIGKIQLDANDLLSRLSNDLLLEIFQYLSYSDLCTISATNKTLHKISQNDKLWKTQVNNVAGIQLFDWVDYKLYHPLLKFAVKLISYHSTTKISLRSNQPRSTSIFPPITLLNSILLLNLEIYFIRHCKLEKHTNLKMACMCV